MPMGRDMGRSFNLATLRSTARRFARFAVLGFRVSEARRGLERGRASADVADENVPSVLRRALMVLASDREARRSIARVDIARQSVPTRGNRSDHDLEPCSRLLSRRPPVEPD